MTLTEWFTHYDEHRDKFSWFITDYFGVHALQTLDMYRAHYKYVKMLDFMNSIWFDLPDSKFNIIENPPGWDEFITLLEAPPNEGINEVMDYLE